MGGACLAQSGHPLTVEGRPPAMLFPLQYKSTPGKKVSVVGWMVQLPDDPGTGHIPAE